LVYKIYLFKAHVLRSDVCMRTEEVTLTNGGGLTHLQVTVRDKEQ